MKKERRAARTSVFGLARSPAYGIGLVHAFQISMQGLLIRKGVGVMAKKQGLTLHPLVNETIVLSHWWDDVGDDPKVLAAYPGLRTKIGDCLLRFAGDNAATVLDTVLDILGDPRVVPPLFPTLALDTLKSLEKINPRSTAKSRWMHLSLLRLLASGLAQTEYMIEPRRYRPLVGIVRQMSLDLMADRELRAIIAETKAEFLLGALASGSQELFPIALPGLEITQEDMDVLGAANLFLGLPICFDKSIEQRREEGMDMPAEDRVSGAELSDYLARAAAVLNERLKTSPDHTTLTAYLKVMGRTHFLMQFPSPCGYGSLNRARPAREGQPGFGTIIKEGFQQLHGR